MASKRRNPGLTDDLVIVGVLGVGAFVAYRLLLKPTIDAASGANGVITTVGQGAAYQWGDLTGQPVPSEICADIAAFRSGPVLPILGPLYGDPNSWDAFRTYARGKGHGTQGYDPGPNWPDCWTGGARQAGGLGY